LGQRRRGLCFSNGVWRRKGTKKGGRKGGRRGRAGKKILERELEGWKKTGGPKKTGLKI